MKQENLKKLMLAALFTALVYVGTCIFFPVGIGNLNLGDGFLLLGAFLLGGPWCVFAASLGAALADLTFGYMTYVPATLIIKALMALAAIFVRKIPCLRHHRVLQLLLAGLASELLMTLGYFLWEGFVLLETPAVALPGVPFNLLQGAFAILISLPVALKMRKQ